MPMTRSAKLGISGSIRRLHRRGMVLVAGVAAMAMVLPLSAGATASAAGGSSSPPVLKHGGSMTVLEDAASQGADPQGIDPATDGVGGANEDYEDAVYGALFELSNSGQVVYDLATGYKYLDGRKTVQIDIRHGVKFSDGTPFNSAALVTNWSRDFQLKAANDPPWPLVTQDPFTTAGPYAADIHLSIPYSPIINSFFDKAPNWIASPTALQKEGPKQFPITPVGAGPFKVVKDVLSSELVLTRNPLYWQKGLPYLDNLTFKTISSDETALEAMKAGQAQAYALMSTLQLVNTFKQSGFTVTTMPGTSPTCLQMNTTRAPFNNIVAREALYYATDVPLLDKKLNDNLNPVVEGFTAPAGLFYYPKVPGYRTFDLAKAQALVKQLGGLSFVLLAGQSGPMLNFDEALQSMWQAAGMKVTLNPANLPEVIQNFAGNKWDAVGCGGSWDPATGVGQNDRFLSNAPFTGVHDPHLDMLLNEATEVPENQRDAIYKEVAQYESQKAYVLEFYPADIWDIADKDVSAPGLTSPHPTVIDAPEVWWQYAGYKQS
jgi:peptide/nickel transport system substrate-binding protein